MCVCVSISLQSIESFMGKHYNNNKQQITFISLIIYTVWKNRKAHLTQQASILSASFQTSAISAGFRGKPEHLGDHPACYCQNSAFLAKGKQGNIS